MSTDAAQRAPAVRRYRWLVVALAAAWLVPALAHFVHADWLLIPAFLGVLGGLHRGLPTVLDRLVIGLGQSFGALCVVALAATWWPWHLHPVALAGTAFTALALLAAASGRRWTAPRRGRPADLLTGIGVAAVAVLAAVPFAIRDLGARIGLLAVGEDFARHFALMDQIGLLGGYAFLHASSDTTLLPVGSGADGMRVYPQGTHLAYAVLDRFLRSSNRNGDPMTAIDVMIWLYVATFVFLAMAVLWAASRVAGPGAHRPGLLAVLTVVAGWLYLGDPVGVFLRGFPNELVGLALAALLTAVVVRPIPRFGDQLATVAMLVIGISFSYHLFLPYAGVLALLWTIQVRAWRRPVTITAAVGTLAAAAITPLVNVAAASTRQLTIAGTALNSDRPAAIVLVVLAAVGLVAGHGLRAPHRRIAAVALGAAVVLLAGLGLFQLITIGRTLYYFDKLLHLTLVVGLVLLGSLARLVPVTGTRRLGAAAATAAVVAVLAAGGGHNHLVVPSYGMRLVTGIEKGSPAGGRDALFLARRYSGAAGTVDVDLMGTPYRNFHGTLFASVLQRNYRYGHAWYDFLNPASAPRTLADLDALLAASPVPVRLHITDPPALLPVFEPPLSAADAARHLTDRFAGRVQVVVEDPNRG